MHSFCLTHARISGLGVALHAERCEVELKIELKVVRSEKMAKWPLKEYADVKEVVNPSSNVKIHSVVSLLLPSCEWG